jgi:hypothetical protein
MTVHLTCGHKATESDGPNGLGWLVTCRDYDRECQPCESVRSICTKCLNFYRTHDMIITEHDNDSGEASKA